MHPAYDAMLEPEPQFGVAFDEQVDLARRQRAATLVELAQRLDSVDNKTKPQLFVGQQAAYDFLYRSL